MGDKNEIDLTDAVAIGRALDTVQRTLDRLVARGHAAAAFEVARAQFRASVRASWPGNVGALVALLSEVEKDQKSELDASERAELHDALEVLRSITHA
jgi:hypothetical protein